MSLALTVVLGMAPGCTSVRGHGPMRASRDPGLYQSPASSTGMPNWADGRSGALKIRELRAWLRDNPGDSAAYWPVEAHLRLAEELLALRESGSPDAGGNDQEECRREFQWVLRRAAPASLQARRAEAGLHRIPLQRLFNFPGMLHREAWGARREDALAMDPAAGSWDWITVHHSAMESSDPLGTNPTQCIAAVRDVQSSHMNGRGYGDVGYHFLIDPAGRVYEGRRLRWRGAHASGDNNLRNIGICLLGNFQHEYPTRSAQASLHELVGALRSSFSIGVTRVVGHDHWRNTECPGRHLRPALNRYR